MSSLSFFKNYIIPEGRDVLLKVCESMHYEIFPSSSFICRSGEIGDKFYVILSGTVKVLVTNKEDESTTEVAKLGEGSSFGEYALLYNQPRMASVLCISETELAVLSKQSYLQILGKIDNKRIEEIVSFLKNFPIFKNWGKNSLVRVSYHFNEISFNRKALIFKEGDAIEKVFFIKEGEFLLTKAVHQESLKRIKKPKIRENAHVSLLSAGEILGEEVLNTSKHLYTCRVNSQTAKVLFISRNDFLGKIKNEELHNIVRQSYENKEKQRIIRINSWKTLKEINIDRDFENDDLDTAKPPWKGLSKSPKVILELPRRTKVNHLALSGSSPIHLALKKSGLSWRNEHSQIQSLPGYLKGKFYEKRYVFPIKIEKKDLIERFRDFQES
jgi:CRP-like cAMP-binding protein